MNKERWQKINEIFHTALEHDTTTREAYLEQATAGDPDLRRHVHELLTQKVPAFLEKPAWAAAPDLAMGDSGSPVNKQIGDYRVIKEIGRGGMGVVYAAEDTRLHVIRALKVLPPEYSKDIKRRQRLIREARIAAALSHPAIAAVFNLVEIGDDLCIVSELVPGRTLREELRGGPIPPTQLLPTLISIAEALAAAHAHGIVHRDLKPENIIRRDDGQIKVLDFGLARPTDPSQMSMLTEESAIVGTPAYMAPEQYTPGADIDARADIFAFGVMAWELATGKNPRGSDPASILGKMNEIVEGYTPRISHVLPVPGLEKIVRRCMRGNPDERYSSAKTLLDDLRDLDQSKFRPLSRHDSFWWWQGHQIIVSTLNASAPVCVWAVRQWVGRPYGSRLFLVSLTLATISVALRLNLFFASRVHQETLIEHRARLFPAIAVLDTLLAASLLVAAAIIADDHDGIAAIFVALAAVMLALLSLIEPATTAAAGLNRPPKTRTVLTEKSGGASR